jgi:hypothetical protein
MNHITDLTNLDQGNALEEVSLYKALHIDAHFASSAKRGSAPLAPHKITWFTGNNKARSIDGKPLPDIAGWAIEQPDLDETGLPEDFDLCDAMELLCQQGKAAPVIVLHQDDSGKPRPVRYWSLPVASLFVVCEGIPSKFDMRNDVELRWGVAYGWPEGQSSSLHCYVYIKELMDAGYYCGFFVHMSSYLTDRMLACLYSHVRVLDAADAQRAKTGDVEPVPFYAYALPITVSSRQKPLGQSWVKPKRSTIRCQCSRDISPWTIWRTSLSARTRRYASKRMTA